MYMLPEKENAMKAATKTDPKFWDGIAAKYAKSPIRDMPAYELTLERTESYLKQTDQVLELGAGTGTTAIRLAPAVAKMVATDFSGALLNVGRERAAKQKVVNVKFTKAAVAEAPSGPFDVVMAFNLLHLLEDLKGSLTEAYARTKPGGYFISKTTCTPHRGAPLHFRMIMAVLPIMQFFGKAPYVRMRSEQELENAIEQAGFVIVETGNYPANPPNRFIVARK